MLGVVRDPRNEGVVDDETTTSLNVKNIIGRDDPDLSPQDRPLGPQKKREVRPKREVPCQDYFEESYEEVVDTSPP